MDKRAGTAEVAQRAAEILEREARVIHSSNVSPKGAWDNAGVKAEHAEMVDIAKRLRKIVKYHKPNPLGGPAVVFEMIADRLRAGHDYSETIADYGLKTVRPRLSA